MGQFDIPIVFLTTQAFFAMGLHSVFKTVQEEEEHQRAEGSLPRNLGRVMLQHFGNIFRQRDMFYIVASLSVLAAIAWAVNVVDISDVRIQVWAFSLALVEALVLFFTIEVVYILVSRWLPPAFKRNRLFGRLVDIAALGAALIFAMSSVTGCMYANDLACSAFGWLGYLAFATFFAAFFISGLGEMALTDNVSDILTSRVPSKRNAHFLSIALLILSMAVLAFLAPMAYFFGPGTGYVILGAQSATLFGIVYLAYLLVRRRESEHFSTLVYSVLMLGLSGLFFAYSFKDVAPADVNAVVARSYAPLELVIPLALFVIGYLSLSMQLPRKMERRLGIRHDRLVASLTFLLVFAVVANYQEAIFSGLGNGVFFFQRGVPVALGLWVAAVWFGIRKVRWARSRGRVEQSPAAPSCLSCGQHLEATSKFCWKCGSTLLKDERVVFAGDARQVFDVKERHSTRRKVVSLVALGPVGFLAFGLDIKRRSGPEHRIVVTDHATHFAGMTYPLERIAGVSPGRYSNSIVLAVKNIETKLTGETATDRKVPSEISLELKTSNPVGLARAIGGVVSKPVIQV